MSELAKLLEGVEVEWKPLGEVYKFQYGTGNTIPTSGGKYPVYGSNGIVGTHSEYNNEDSPVIGHIGAYAGIVNWGKGKHFVTYNGVICKLVNKTVNSRYAYYQLLKQDFNSMAKNSSQPFVSYKELNEVIIPIPSLPVQEEIVRILDTFTERTETLINELTTELEARKKQYYYYREKLLSFKEGEVEWKTLGEIGELVRGNGLPKTDFTVTGVPAIHYGQIYTFYGTYTENTISFVSKETAKKLNKVERGDVVITNTSENFEDVGKAVVYLGEEQAVTGGHATIFKPSKVITGKYFAYFTQTSHFSSQKRKYAKGTKVIDVSAKDMAKIMIPIPQREKQERIVTILDKLESLTISIREALPIEIALRKKQYDYYRDLLFTFSTDNIKA